MDSDWLEAWRNSGESGDEPTEVRVRDTLVDADANPVARRTFDLLDVDELPPFEPIDDEEPTDG